MNEIVRSTSRSAPHPLAALAAGVSAMWVIEGVDQALLDERLDAYGIVPREIDGLIGVITHPFLHAGFAHLMANTVPLLVLGALIAVKGYRRLAAVAVGTTLLGGSALWLVGRDATHIGASLVVFGFFGYLLGAAFFERRLRSILLAVVAVVLYGSLIWGVLPSEGSISWEGHLCGLLAGVATARVVATPARVR